MLQRAASNAYSWWWASNIRAKQSKWLDSNLPEMEERVSTMIKLIEPDADSFGKRAELYFRRRPELIDLVEETYKSYKALADRYDRISGELHKANHIIATALPDQVLFEMQDEDDDSPKAVTLISASKFSNQSTEVPQPSLLNKSTENSPATRRLHHKSIISQISKDKAQEEIDRLQKEILVLQTEKEFIKSSYETGLAKYLDIERQITEKHDEVCSLQDAFSASSAIEDDEARALMVARAIKSCEDTLVNLQKQQKKSCGEARIESARIKGAKQKLKTLKGGCENEDNSDQTEPRSSTVSVDEDDCGVKEGRMELVSICQKVKEHFESSSESSVLELAEKVDELVDKVIDLELSVSSQSVQINTLRSETDELQKSLHSLEEEKAVHIGDSNMLTERLRQAEEALQKIQQLEQHVHSEKCRLQVHFSKVYNNFNNLSEKLQSPKHLSQENLASSSQNWSSSPKLLGQEILVGSSQNGASSSLKDLKEDNIMEGEHHENRAVSEFETLSRQLQADSFDIGDGSKSEAPSQLLTECASMLHSCNDTEKRLSEIEKRNQEYQLETMVQVKELKSANDMKDQEIRSLRRILSSLQARFTANMPQNVEKSEEEEQSVAKSSMPLETNDKENPQAEEDIKLCQVKEELHVSSPLEEKFRADIDSLLEENLDFWLRFSTSYHQIQSFQSRFNNLEGEMEKLKGSSMAAGEPIGKEDPVPLDKKLRELNTDLQVWLEKNVLLKGELQCRFTSLCSIQEEIESIYRMSQTEDVQFTAYQAAKFQGEVLNMQQENHKVAKELEAGLDHVSSLQAEIRRALMKLRENFNLHGSQSNNQIQHSGNISTKTMIPLHTFLFGRKLKKQSKQSIFSCVNPALQKQYSNLRAVLPTRSWS